MSWSIEGGEFKLHISGCDLEMVHHARARSCLASLGHVVFVGDSVSRFFFVSLVHFLHTGSWMPIDGLPPSDATRAWVPPPTPDTPEPVLDLLAYQLATSARLGGHEVCDCHVGLRHIEARYYQEAGVALSFVAFFSHRYSVLLHDPTWLNVSCAEGPPCKQAGCAVGNCSADASPAAALLELEQPEALDALPALLAADLLVLNAGIHDAFDRPEDMAQLQRLAAQGSAAGAWGGGGRRDIRGAWRTGVEARQRKGVMIPTETAVKSSVPPFSRGGLVWRTTTPSKLITSVGGGQVRHRGNVGTELHEGGPPAAPLGPWPAPEANISRTVRESGGRVFDAYALLWPLIRLALDSNSTAPFSHPHDIFHFSPAVNAQVNQALLAMLCEHLQD